MRGFVPAQLLLVLGLVVLTGVVYYRYSGKVNLEIQKPLVTQPTPIPENKYENSQFGFNLTLPDDFKVEEETEDEFYKREKADYRKNFRGYVESEPAKVLSTFNVKNSDAKIVLSLWIFDNPDKLTAENFYNKQWYFPFIWGMFNPPDKKKDAPHQTATISGILANYAEISYQDNIPKFYYLPFNDNMFLLRVLGSDKVGEEILNSFKHSN